MAPPQSYCLDYHFPSDLEPQSVAVPALVSAEDNLIRTMGEGDSLALDPAKGSRPVCTPCEERVCGNAELPHTQSDKLWISKKEKNNTPSKNPTPQPKNICPIVLQRESAKQKAPPHTETLKLK